MWIPFQKYQGTGNDFVILHAADLHQELTSAQISFCCDRRKGIGADGLMILRPHPDYDFEMLYFNADGFPGSMCGNGGRCLVRFAQQRGLITDECRFLASDGEHRARLLPDGSVALAMKDVDEVIATGKDCFLNTGSPHYVRFVGDVDLVDVVQEGRSIRNSEDYRTAGTNVNFVSRRPDGSVYVRTYERGVEDETLSCGTGVTASAIASKGGNLPDGTYTVDVKTRGGDLFVSFRKQGDVYSDIELVGPAQFVFKGSIEL
jgi:diaminopimelate epimerase